MRKRALVVAGILGLASLCALLAWLGPPRLDPQPSRVEPPAAPGPRDGPASPLPSATDLRRPDGAATRRDAGPPFEVPHGEFGVLRGVVEFADLDAARGHAGWREARPLADCPVELRLLVPADEQNSSFVGRTIESTRTNADGAFEFSLRAPGRYFGWAMHAAAGPPEVYSEEVTVLSMPPAESARVRVILRERRPPVRIEGRVTWQSTGAPVVAAAVSIKGHESRTDESGAFRFEPVNHATDAQHLVVMAPGMPPYGHFAQDPTSSILVSLPEPTCRLRVDVQDLSGTAVAGVRVTVTDPFLAWFATLESRSSLAGHGWSATSAIDGSVTFDGLMPSRYMIDTAPAIRLATLPERTILVASDTTAECTAVVAADLRPVEVHLRGTDGQPITSGVTVSALYAFDGPPIEGVVAGPIDFTHTLGASGPGVAIIQVPPEARSGVSVAGEGFAQELVQLPPNSNMVAITLRRVTEATVGNRRLAYAPRDADGEPVRVTQVVTREVGEGVVREWTGISGNLVVLDGLGTAPVDVLFLGGHRPRLLRNVQPEELGESHVTRLLLEPLSATVVGDVVDADHGTRLSAVSIYLDPPPEDADHALFEHRWGGHVGLGVSGPLGFELSVPPGHSRLRFERGDYHRKTIEVFGPAAELRVDVTRLESAAALRIFTGIVVDAATGAQLEEPEWAVIGTGGGEPLIESSGPEIVVRDFPDGSILRVSAPGYSPVEIELQAIENVRVALKRE